MKWEYKFEKVDMNDKISGKKQEAELTKLQERVNSLGAEGWEMISYESIPLTGTFSGDVKGYAYMMFFKRQTS